MGLKYLFYFVMLFFAFYDLRWWTGVVRPMGNHFFVQFQKCVVKYGVDLLGLGNFKLAVDTVHNKNFEWPMLFWG